MLKLARLSLIATALVAAPAIAGSQQPWLSITETDEEIAARISFNDLDLKSPAGADALRHRVSYASHEVCSAAHEDGMQRTTYAIASRNCGLDLAAAAAPQVNNVLRRARVQVEVTSLIVIGFGR